MTKQRPFVVLALPRSRTAWLSLLLRSNGQFLVGHDITVECQHIRQFLDSFKNGMIGTVETGAILAWRLIRHEMPEARLVTVHRPLGEVVDSLAKFGIKPTEGELEAREAMLEACRSAKGVESIDWRDLDDPACCQWLYELLLGVPLDEAWYREIAGLNIQINMLERSKRLWQNREALASLRAEVIEETRRLPVEDRAWMG